MVTLGMRTSACVYGCPEYRPALSACADLNHYSGIPVRSKAGVSDSHCLDQQATVLFESSFPSAQLTVFEIRLSAQRQKGLSRRVKVGACAMLDQLHFSWLSLLPRRL